MEGQFFKKLSLIKNDKDERIGVAVSGPLIWDSGTSATISATVSQDGVTVEGVTHVTNADHVWAVAVIGAGDGVLKEGRATGEATATVRTADDPPEFVSWSSPPDPDEICLV